MVTLSHYFSKNYHYQKQQSFRKILTQIGYTRQAVVMLQCQKSHFLRHKLLEKFITTR